MVNFAWMASFFFERDREMVQHDMWIGFSMNHLLDLDVVFKFETAFDPQCIRKTQMTLPIPVLCFRVGPQSRCLQEWNMPKCEFEGAYHEVKIVKTIRGQKKTRGLLLQSKGPPLMGPQRWVGQDAQFIDNSSRIGCNILNSSLITPVTLKKRRGLLLDTY